ncbi:AAA family ATPase [Vibrio gigantis]|uniref:AAA family ATPase n=1 Tax=Vibrio gigantis TaxID=296199 RepID=UPI0035A5BFDB
MKIYISKTLGINTYDGFHLVQDNIVTGYHNPWNDYDYFVTFWLYHVSNGEKTKIDSSKLLINGEMKTTDFLLEKGVSVTDKISDITSIIEELEAVSLGESINYYQKINFILAEDREQINNLLYLLHDASYQYDNEAVYSQYTGYEQTIKRDGETAKSLIRKGYHVALGTYQKDKSFKLCLDSPLPTIDPIEFKFDISKEIAKTNINLIIGENGSGKTHILKRISEVMLGITKNSSDWPFFHKLVITSYSPFENFYTKEEILNLLDKKNDKNNSSKRDKERRNIHINKYAYIGFKDKKNKFNLNWPKESSVNSIEAIIAYDQEENWWNEYSRLDNLKDTLSLSMDFDEIAVKIKDDDFYIIDSKSYKTFNKIKNEIKRNEGLFFLKNGLPIKLSSGQEIFSYMIPSLAAEIEDESLIVIDEPELYLHPTLEVALINMLKNLLDETNSSAIIATHSALIAREVADDGVLILKKKDGYTTVQPPEIQTFGESLEVIIGEAFDDYTTYKPFQLEIDQLIEDGQNVQDLLKDISSEVGDEALVYISSPGTKKHIGIKEKQ